jgi:hypothetical protein
VSEIELDRRDYKRACMAVAAIMAAVTAALLLLAMTSRTKPAPEEPPVETVEVPTEARSDDPATWEGPPIIELAEEAEEAEREVTYQAAGDYGYLCPELVAKAAWGFTPEGFAWNVENYLAWRELYPEGYAQMVRWYRGEPCPLQLDPPMVQAVELAGVGADIDEYLARRGSPLSGYGLEFAKAGYDWSVNPFLLVAVAGAESTFATNGSLSRTNHNAWGMLGSCPGVEHVNGACWWPDWPTAIDGAAMFMSYYWPEAQTAYDLRGYCEGNPPSWIGRVEGVRRELGGAPWTR